MECHRVIQSYTLNFMLCGFDCNKLFKDLIQQRNTSKSFEHGLKYLPYSIRKETLIRRQPTLCF